MLNSLGGEPLQPTGEQGSGGAGGQSDLLTYLLTGTIQVGPRATTIGWRTRVRRTVGSSYLLTSYIGGETLQPTGEQGPGGQ